MLRNFLWRGSMPARAFWFMFIAISAMLFATAGCGYRVGGRAANLPHGWKMIAVPALVNRTSHYRIEQRLTEAVIHELLARTSYRVVQDKDTADGVVLGEISSIEASPVLFDTVTGRVTTLLVTVRGNVRLVDRATQKPVYQNQEFVFREEYQVATDVQSFFEEQGPALDRLARDFAAKFVAGMLESF